jgi:rifampicin phosphotransferase
LDRHFPGEGYVLSTALLAGGEPSVTARQGYELMALARLSQKIARRENREASDRPQHCQYRENPEFQHAFARFLDDYGHRGVYETYFRNPRWREMPEYLLALLAQLAETDETALRARQQAAVAEALARIKAGVPFWKRAFIERLAKAARQECNQREAARSALAQETDIFQLMLSEILRALSGDIPAAGVRARVAERNRQFEQWSQEIALDVLVEAAQHPLPGWQAQDTIAVENGSSRYQGIPTGTGRARGKACLLRHPSEGYRLRPGDILVAPSTDPGWTPLFLSAGGLVVETGGYLSHGAIVAREFGIPAVVNLPGILVRLKDGDMVEVDGTSGVVTLLEQ